MSCRGAADRFGVSASPVTTRLYHWSDQRTPIGTVDTALRCFCRAAPSMAEPAGKSTRPLPRSAGRRDLQVQHRHDDPLSAA